MSAHVPTYMLIEVADGELEPERMPPVLDHIERCSECAASLQVVVTLKANRDEALRALRTAEDEPAGAEVREWAPQGLRLAVSIAITSLLVWWLLSFLR